MFNKDFFPTQEKVIKTMLSGEDISNKIILEPSAGKGNIVDYLNENGAASVLACEIDTDLSAILQTKCKLIGADFLEIKSDQVSHVNMIIMNPPFSCEEYHILHAFEIAPAGSRIISLCNAETIKNPFSKTRKQILSIIENNGFFNELGNCFNDSERKTDVNIGLIKITKPGNNYTEEFSGFFMDEEPESDGQIGLMRYNVVRDLVNRYVAAIKLYDKQIETGKQMNSLLSGFYGESLTFTCTEKGAVKLRQDFKKDLQKSGWKFIFNEMNLTKNTTRGLMNDINKFVETQTEIPFTMKNIYHMLDIVRQTTGQRMDKAILEVFDRVTAHHHDNRYNLPGWKTNGHFVVGKKFILPYMISPAKEYGYISTYYSSLKNSWDGIIPDFEKALCYVTGENYDNIKTVNGSINRNIYGDWYDSHFFKYKGYKNGNMHFEFKDEKTWQIFNQRIAKLKGFALYEPKEQTEYQKRQTGRNKPTDKKTVNAKVLFEI